MRKIFNSITELVGGTPLLRLGGFMRENALRAEVAAKLEYLNPTGSVKDRAAVAMIDDAERRGLLAKGGTIIEPTSGNTGIALAAVAAVRGYRLILTMPDTMSAERRRLIAAYGAELVLTDGAKGMQGAVDKALELGSSIEGAFVPMQFDNFANRDIHEATTGKEIWQDTGGRVDTVVFGVGTGGTLSGAARFLKCKNPSIKIVAVEPDTSAVLSGGERGAHRIQGIGAGFVPRVLDTSLIDQIITVTEAEAKASARQVARTDGVLVGISSGAALHAAASLAAHHQNADKLIIALLPDGGERYLSTDLFV